ncbi:hypothetical protein PV11_09872 [Exophiala sideris]|uniref:Uncharacterized protein n=1 Tax=Exophiala sideris TaxID=1016849 RepID=A0A0D1YBF0_9EURO|nr:hypothetical protein PV11_09872 [Exophiala sideris]
MVLPSSLKKTSRNTPVWIRSNSISGRPMRQVSLATRMQARCSLEGIPDCIMVITALMTTTRRHRSESSTERMLLKGVWISAHDLWEIITSYASASDPDLNGRRIYRYWHLKAASRYWRQWTA